MATTMTTSTTPTRLEVSYSTAHGYTNLSASITSTPFGAMTTEIPYEFYQTCELTVLWIEFAFIVVGNATVLIALLLSKGHKSRMNFFIKHLAAADLSVGLISVLTEIIWKTTISFEGGLVMCKVIRFLQCVVTFSSNYVLVALSIDRCDAITHPMNFSGSWKRARILVAVAWILSVVFASPTLFLMEIKEFKNGYGTQCWNPFEEWQWQIYVTLISIVLFFIPAILISACYIIIVITIWKKGRTMQTTAAAAAASSGGGGGTSASGTAALEQEQETRRASSRGLIPKAKVKTVKMTFVIIFVFILCWTPYMLFDLLQVFGWTSGPAIATFIQSFAHLNSAANPLIYCLFSTNIGATLCGIIRCRKRQEILPTGLTTSGTHSTSQSVTRSSAYPASATTKTLQLVPSVPSTTKSTTGGPPRPSVTFRTAASIEA